jgi:hypothetical protein
MGEKILGDFPLRTQGFEGTAKRRAKSRGNWEYGAPETIRTSDLQLRRLLLYPAELRALIGRTWRSCPVRLHRY